MKPGSILMASAARWQVFAMRSMASGAAFHRAYLHVTQQAFLEAHELAFAYFGGVFRLLRYDNLASAVRKILRGHRREETVRFLAFRSHWRFTAEFCTLGEGHEKGGIAGEGGYFRRNHLVPVPCMADLDALNTSLVAHCRGDEARVLAGRVETVGALMSVEREHLLPRAAEGFDIADIAFPLVDKQGWVTVKTNFYSVPVKAGSRVEARIRPLHVEIWHGGKQIARHERCHQRRQHVLDLEHYLDVLSHKPGAFAGSKPPAQWRAAGRWLYQPKTGVQLALANRRSASPQPGRPQGPARSPQAPAAPPSALHSTVAPGQHQPWRSARPNAPRCSDAPSRATSAGPYRSSPPPRSANGPPISSQAPKAGAHAFPAGVGD